MIHGAVKAVGLHHPGIAQITHDAVGVHGDTEETGGEWSLVFFNLEEFNMCCTGHRRDPQHEKFLATPDDALCAVPEAAIPACTERLQRVTKSILAV